MMPVRTDVAAPSVVPAQAGIQCFRGARRPPPSGDAMRLRTIALLLLALPALATAHAGHDHPPIGFVQGLLHPLTGLDHLLAMVAVAWWSAATQTRRWWIAPLAFACATLAGAVAAASLGIAWPGVEFVIASSVLVFGVVMLAAWRAPVAIAGTLAAVLGAAHGVAHGVELGAGGGAGAWLFGMAIGTLLLHGAGAMLGRVAVARAQWSTRVAGAATAAVGVVLIVASL